MLGFAKRLVKQAEGIIAPEIALSSSHGFRVLHVEDNSPASAAGIEPLFDYIVAVNGTRFGTDDSDYRASDVYADHSPVYECEAAIVDAQGSLYLTVFSAKGKEERDVHIDIPPASLVGISLQWTPLSAADNVWHVLNVTPNSPAEKAGLKSHADYIVACESGFLETGGEHRLAEVIAHANPTDGIILYVYNRDYNIVRPARVFPSAQGKLGCGVGYGLLHSLPKPAIDRSTMAGTIFDESSVDTASLQPLNPLVPVPLPPQPLESIDSEHTPTNAARMRPRVHEHGHVKPRNGQDLPDLNAYFSEQSQISRSIDGGSRTVASDVPPPPM